ncbi:MAGE family-domain-containing protein [Pholiota molesta]|nr:MAGE family-domain-containing protein [Pholiota molesta]
MGRSSARPGPSQSQRPTQTQRARGRRAAVVEEEEEEVEEQVDEDEAMDMDEGATGLTRQANDLVRLALFMEHKRAVIRREDINKKVLGNTRAFNTVFEMAQAKLRDTFGMELVELPSRAGLDKDGDDEPNETQIATTIKKKANALGSKTYILRSTLDPVLIDRAAQTEGDILEEEAGDQATLFPSQVYSGDEGDESDDDAERPPKYYGSLISWSKADQIGSVGILYVILALVLVSGRAISDVDLRRYLQTLHLPSNPNVLPVQHSASATTRSLNLDSYLSNLIRQGYLDRYQVGGEAAGKKGKKGGGMKRLRTQAEDLDEGRTYEWRWGARAFCEVGEEFVAKFVAEFMVGNVDGDGGRQEELVKKMYAGVEKAAGGKLAELR